MNMSKFPLYRQHDAMQCGVTCLHVAGLAALILERNPKLTAAKVREIIARNAKKVGQLTVSCGMEQFFLTHVKLSCLIFTTFLWRFLERIQKMTMFAEPIIPPSMVKWNGLIQ